MEPAFRLSTPDQEPLSETLNTVSAQPGAYARETRVDPTDAMERAFFLTPLAVSELVHVPHLSSYLITNHVFIQRKIDLSTRLTSHYLLPMLNLIPQNPEYTNGSEDKKTVSPQVRRSLFTCDCSDASVLLAEPTSADIPMNHIVEQLFDEASSANRALWLIGYLAEIDKRLLARFNNFFIFQCSEKELNVVRDLVILSSAHLQELSAGAARVLFFSDRFRVRSDGKWFNPSVLELA